MKKKIIIPIILVIALIIGYFGVKLFYLYYYNIDSATLTDYSNFIDSLKITDTMVITKSETEDYLSFKNIKVKNEFSNFKKLENQYSEDTIKYVLHDENNNVKASFWMGTTVSYIDTFRNDSSIFFTYGKRITNDTLIEILDENKVTNDIQLLNYLVSMKNVKNNIFTSVKAMKKNYAIQFMVAAMMPQIESVTMIDGDYTGFIYNMKQQGSLSNVYEARIISDNKVYFFTFLSKDDYFSKQDINRILNSVEFE